MAIHGPFSFPISATLKLFRHSRKNTQPFQNWYGFSKQTKTHWSCVFPLPGKPEADGQKQTNVRMMKKSLSGQEWKLERTEQCSLEKWCREILAAKYTPWHWYKGQRGRTFWVLWSQEHSIKRRGKENVMIKWMKYINAMHSPEGPQHYTNSDLSSGRLKRKLTEEDNLQVICHHPSWPSFQLEQH